VSETRPPPGKPAPSLEVANRSFRLVSPTTAVCLAVLIALFGVVDVLLATHDHHLDLSTAAVFASLLAVSVLVGLVIAVRQPRNAMGWCLMGVPFFAVISNAASTYSVLDYRMRHGSLPLGAVAVLLQPSWAPAIVLFVFALLIFPDGVAQSRLSLWVMRIMTGFGIVWIAGAIGIAVSSITAHNVRVDGGGNLLAIDYPKGAWAWWGVVDTAIFPASIAGLALWGIQQVPKYRRSTGDRRLQLKWLYGGAVISIACAVAFFALGNTGTTKPVYVVLLVALALGLAALPISMGVAILKLRLYDIDRVVSRTVSYALVTGLLVGVYAGIVTLATRVLPFSSPVAVAASTLAAVALFNPLRRRVQHVVDRRFNRARYDAEATVAAFSARLREAVDLETVRTELLEVVNRAVEPAHASVWIRRRA
jgi:hypothetical protein